MNCSIQFSKTIYVRMDLRNIYRYISHTQESILLVFHEWGPMNRLKYSHIPSLGSEMCLISPVNAYGHMHQTVWVWMKLWLGLEGNALVQLECCRNQNSQTSPWTTTTPKKRECFKTTYCSRSLKYLQKNQTKTPIINRGLWSVISGVGASITDE